VIRQGAATTAAKTHRAPTTRARALGAVMRAIG